MKTFFRDLLFPTRFFAFLLLLALVGVLCFSCASMGIPAMDANHDGVVDPAFTAWQEATKNSVNTATGGAVAPWLEILSVAVSGLAAAGVAVAHALGKKDHEVNVAQIEQLKQKVGLPPCPPTERGF